MFSLGVGTIFGVGTILGGGTILVGGGIASCDSDHMAVFGVGFSLFDFLSI